MVAAVGRADGQIVAVHRTYITTDGRKAPVEPVKAMLGPCASAAVWLAPAGPVLAVTEGIETALAVSQIAGVPTWAALSASGMTGLELPPLPLAAELIVCADFDAAGLKAAETLAARAYGEGRQVRVAIPGHAGDDWNDVLAGVP
jgi:putative DNA primase/helicase